MQKELQDSLLKIVSGDNLKGMSVIFVRTNDGVFSLGVLSNTRKMGFLTFNPVLKDKSFSIYNMNGVLKHITLVDTKKWHITCEKNKNKKFPKHLSKKTTKISDDLVHWFGISVRKIDNLYQILKPNEKEHNLSLNFTGIPPSDSNRRLDNLSYFLGCNHELAFIQIENHIDKTDYFYHFEFYICRKGNDDFLRKEGKIGFFSPVVEYGVKIPMNVLRLKKVGIQDRDVVVLSAQIPGTIKEPVRIWFKQ